MVLHTNINLDPKEAFRIKGNRTLQINNYTDMWGKWFPDSFITFQKRASTSILMISDLIPNRETPDFVFGLYLGQDFEILSGCRFEGNTLNNGGKWSMAVFAPNGQVKENGIVYRLDEEWGWKQIENNN